MKQILFSFLFIISCNSLYAQRPGDLDSTFGVNGIVVTEFEGYDTEINQAYFDGIKAIFVLSDGKILCAGSADSMKHFIAGRYNADGSIDESYGTSGFTILENIGSLKNAKLTANGKLLMAGYKENKFVLARLRNDGSIDSTFGENGIVIHEIENAGYSVFLQGLDVQIDNKILAQGSLLNDTFYSYLRYQVIVRYHEDGSIDESFADDGRLVLYLLPYWLQNSAFNIINDNQIYSTYYQSVFKINNAGIVDSTFGDGGHVTFNAGMGYSGLKQIFSSAFTNDNSIIYLAVMQYEYGSSFKTSLNKLKISGIIDSTFGINGSTLFDVDPIGYNYHLYILVNEKDKIFISGFRMYTESSVYKFSFEIIRFHENGSIDSTFGENGIVRTLISDSSLAFCSALQDDGKLLVAGVSDSGAFTIARYHAHSDTPTSILPLEKYNTLLLYPNPVSDVLFIDEINETILQIEIKDVLGREMHLPINNQSIDVSSLPSGLYFIKVKTEKGELFGKFVKR